MNTLEKINSPNDFYHLIQSKGYDHIDFGCSKGGSLQLCKNKFHGKRGLGIDIDQKKVELTQSSGFDAVLFDINDIPAMKLVKFTVMSHFLEHIPNAIDCKNFVKKACEISSDFVFIQQPYFDADTNLARDNLKLFWSDWRGHPNRMTGYEMYLLLRDLKNDGLKINFSIHNRGFIKSSDDKHIHSLASPIDQHHYDLSIHPIKANIAKFQYPVYRELVVLITMSDIEHDSILKLIDYDATCFDVNGKSMNDKSKRYNKLADCKKMLKSIKKIVK